jgi:uncharacterized protein (DUF486 family)
MDDKMSNKEFTILLILITTGVIFLMFAVLTFNIGTNSSVMDEIKLLGKLFTIGGILFIIFSIIYLKDIKTKRSPPPPTNSQ